MSLSDGVLYFTGDIDSLDTLARRCLICICSICCQPATRARNS